ncbi:MAG: class 3 adenylate cyclase [Bacteroidia bacterium]|jgi:class 3 adenylate cyclase
MRNFLIIASVILSHFGFAQQSGLPYFNEVSVPADIADSRINSIIQAEDGTMIFGSSSGILSYDGLIWNLTPTPSTPTCLWVNDLNGSIYIGMENGVAELIDSDTSFYEVRKLDIPELEAYPISDLFRFGESMVIRSTNRLLLYSLQDEKVTSEISLDGETTEGAFNSDGILAAFDVNGKVFNLNTGTASLTKHTVRKNIRQRFRINLGENSVFSDFQHRLYRAEGQFISEITGDLGKFCQSNLISGLTQIDDSLMAVSTLAGGFVIANAYTSKIVHRANYGTGFPDNEVFCIGSDNQGGIWVSYESQLIRVNLNDPIATYSGYPGLEGILLATSYHENTLYVATSSGLFYLTSTSDRKEVERIMELEKTQGFGPDLNLLPTIRPTVSTNSRIGAGRPSAGKTGGMDMLPPGANIPGMKSKTKPLNPLVKTPKSGSTKLTTPQIEKRNLFKKVSGINVKCRKLFSHQAKLFSIANNGLYEITGSKAKRISKEAYVLDATSDQANSIFYSTSTEIIRLSRTNNSWRSIALSKCNGIVGYSLLAMNDDLWLGSTNSVSRYNGTKDILQIDIPSSGNERIKVVDLYGKPHFLASKGIYHYILDQNSVVNASIPGIETSNRYRYQIGSDGSVWAKDHIGWKVISDDALIPKTLYLKLFEDVTGFSSTPAKELFVIEGGKEIHRISSQSLNKESSVLTVQLKKIESNGNHELSDGNLEVKANTSSVKFTMSAPQFLKSGSTQFQYRIDGIRDNWSSWNSNSTFEIPILNPGDFQLQVRARNILGEISGVEHVSFTVNRPIWTSWYMVALYVLVVGLFVWVVVQVRVRSLQSNQRELEAMVTSRTAALEEEKGKVEELLLNILPKETAEELQLKGRATPRQYNSATVLFTDFKDFTKITSKASAEELVSELDRYFTTFDRICGKYGIEKIKTIGDSYMCAGGIPAPSSDHALACALAAMDMIAYIQEVAEAKTAQGLKPWEIRIGLHSGPIMAGVVGEKKFAYDVWGDTVNIASRMESSSEPGKINISTATYGLIRDVFNVENRGKIEAKGKGKLEMHFITGIKSSFLEDGQPSALLIKRVQKPN